MPDAYTYSTGLKVGQVPHTKLPIDFTFLKILKFEYCGLVHFATAKISAQKIAGERGILFWLKSIQKFRNKQKNLSD